MKQKILRSIYCAIFFLTQPLSAQNQSLVADASNSTPINLIRNRQAEFPNLGEVYQWEASIHRISAKKWCGRAGHGGSRHRRRRGGAVRGTFKRHWLRLRRGDDGIGFQYAAMDASH